MHDIGSRDGRGLSESCLNLTGHVVFSMGTQLALSLKGLSGIREASGRGRVDVSNSSSHHPTDELWGPRNVPERWKFLPLI